MKSLCDCGEPATKSRYGRQWCIECLEGVEAEMAAFNDSKPALNDEDAFLIQQQQKRKPARPHEL